MENSHGIKASEYALPAKRVAVATVAQWGKVPLPNKAKYGLQFVV